MIFREEGWVAEVEVVSTDEHDDVKRKTLKVIRTLSNSGFIKLEALPKDGEVFIVSVRTGFESYAGWTLRAY